MRFVSELKRRNVIRKTGLYLVGAWLLIQSIYSGLNTMDAGPSPVRST